MSATAQLDSDRWQYWCFLPTYRASTVTSEVLLRWQAGMYRSHCSALDSRKPDDFAGFLPGKKTCLPLCSDDTEVSPGVVLSDSEFNVTKV
jgi:hypothetical protein